MRNSPLILASSLFAMTAALAGPARADIMFDQDVTPDVIFGSGNANGSFTRDQSNGVEIGLRAKLRHNGAGFPENTFNSNGEGTYSYNNIVAPGQSFPTAEWSFEWTVNSDYLDSSGTKVGNLTYQLGIDGDPGPGVNFLKFDPISVPCADHAFGDNTTGNGGGVTAASCPADYAALLAGKNVVQQSWKPHWFIGAAPYNFDPTTVGNYAFFLLARDGDGAVVAMSNMQVLVGGAAAVTAYTCNDNSGTFYAPMDKPVMVKKKNQTLPLKMTCTDADGNILGDGDIAAPSLAVVKTHDGTSTVDDPVTDIQFTGKGTDGNEFVFDADSGTWQFNLKTKNFSSAGTYQINANGPWGQTPVATIQMK